MPGGHPYFLMVSPDFCERCDRPLCDHDRERVYPDDGYHRELPLRVHLSEWPRCAGATCGGVGMNAATRPRVIIEAASGSGDGDKLLKAIEDMIDRTNILKRDGVILSIEDGTARADGGLAAFNPAQTVEKPPEPDDGPEPATAHGFDVTVTDGFSTTQEREARNDDRVVDDAGTCVGCGNPYNGDGLCEDCTGTRDLVDDRFRAAGGGA